MQKDGSKINNATVDISATAFTIKPEKGAYQMERQ
jgi:hypothetical protein